MNQNGPQPDYIAPGIRHLAVPLADLTPDPANVRTHSQRNLDAIRGSLLRFKQQTPIVVDSQGIIRKGNGTAEAARSLGWELIAAVRTDLSGGELVGYGVADNRSGDPEVGSTFDQAALASTLEALRAEDESLMESAGYTADELADLLEQQAPAEEPEAPSDFPELDENIHCDYCCPKCGYSWSGKAAG